MWTRIALITSALVALVLIISSLRVGFTFLVAPIVLCDLALLAVVQLLSHALPAEEERGESQDARRRVSGSAPPRVDSRYHQGE